MSIRWHESGVPFQPRSATASCSLDPTGRPKSRRLTPSEVCDDAHSRYASCSTSLMTRRPSALSMSMSVAFSTTPPSPDQASKLVDDVRRHVAHVWPGIGLPADEPDAGASVDSLFAQDLGQRTGSVARLAGQAEVLESVTAHRKWCRTGRAPVLVAHEDRGLALKTHDQQRLLEARIEAGQVRDVGAVLTVGVHDEPMETAPLHPLTQSLEPGRVRGGGDLGHLCRACRNRAARAEPIWRGGLIACRSSGSS